MKHNTDVYTRNVWGRYLSKDDETMIENFFKNMGYQVIDCSNYSVEEQISIAYNSTHIVGIAGAAFVNTIFCNSNANVISLNISDIQNFPFWIMPMSVNVNYISIPQNIMFDAEHATRFDGNDIIKMVLNQEQLFL
jgi:capsular polysaccharide biosynthesis protein